MDEDATTDATSSETIQWRRDASTSRTVRLLWSLGVGTFFAAIAITVCWRLYDLAARAGVGAVVVAFFAALAVTLLALVLTGKTERYLAAFARRLPFDAPPVSGLERVTDAVLGTLAMIGVIGGLMAIGRIAPQRELFDVAARPFIGLAALSIPLAVVALVLASFLRSVGTLDPDEGTIYLHEPDHAIDLEVIEGVSAREIGDATLLTLEYAQPDGQYVPGPRRLVVPPEVARELESLVDRRESA